MNVTITEYDLERFISNKKRYEAFTTLEYRGQTRELKWEGDTQEEALRGLQDWISFARGQIDTDLARQEVEANPVNVETLFVELEAEETN